MKNLLLIALILCAFNSQAQNLTAANVTFVTPSGTDEKDHDTRVVVTLYSSNGDLIGTCDLNSCNGSSTSAQAKACFCCTTPLRDNQGNITDQMTRFPDNGSERGPFAFSISTPVTKDGLQTGYFKIKVRPNGNDRWIFVPKLTLTFSDGTSAVYYKYSNTIVAQDASEAFIVFNPKMK